MDLTFDNIIMVIADSFFGGSSTLAGLAILLACWAVCAVICLNLKASPTYTVVPLIPLSIFFTSYGILDEYITVIIILVAAVLVAREVQQVV